MNTIDYFTLSPLLKDKIVKLLVNYMNENNISCADAIYQNDNAGLNAIPCVVDMVKVVENFIYESGEL